MKKLLLLLVLLSCSQVQGQDYKLFNGSSRKLFTDSALAYSLAFDSVVYAGNDSVYFNFFNRQDTLIPSDSCAWWGNLSCYTQNRPVWSGKKIACNNQGNYQFFPLSPDTIFFDFTISAGDTSLFYKDTTQQFFIVYEKVDTVTVLNNPDSARFYKIIHTDLSGTVINSLLNGQYIIICKDFGLMQFFQVDSFPQVLKPLYLLGSQSPDAGLFQLTGEMLYDYQPGDEIQYRNVYIQTGGPPPSNYNYYVKYTILNRTVSTDSMLYDVIRKNYNAFSYVTVTDTIVLKYYRHHVIAGIPFESYNGNLRRLHQVSYCGIKLWTYSFTAEPYLGYCVKENCWGPIDTGGPPPSLESDDIAGLGHEFLIDLISPPPMGYYSGYQIVYFKKDGIPCGNEILGINEITAQHHITVSPNPFSEYAMMDVGFPIFDATLTVYNMMGEVVKSMPHIYNQNILLQRSNLPAGMYFIRLTQEKTVLLNVKVLIVD